MKLAVIYSVVDEVHKNSFEVVPHDTDLKNINRTGNQLTVDLGNPHLWQGRQNKSPVAERGRERITRYDLAGLRLIACLKDDRERLLLFLFQFVQCSLK